MNLRDLGRHALLKVSFMRGLGIVTTWVMQLFVISMTTSNVFNNHNNHHEYLIEQVFTEGKD